MKFVLIGVIVLGMAYIGVGIAKFYRTRKRFFEDIVLLCEKLCVDISFSKENLKTIVENNMECFAKELKTVVSNYVCFLETNESSLEKQNLFEKKCVLKEDEKEVCLLFFKSLGRLDASNQICEIENFKAKFLSLKSVAEEENKKFGSLSLKLMLLFGVLIGIILI